MSPNASVTGAAVLCATALAALAVLAVLADRPASAAGVSRRCDAHRAYRKDSLVLVYRRASGHDDGVGNPLTTFYACGRPGGASIAVAADSSPGVGEYPPNDVLEELVVAGRFVGTIMVRGEGDQSSCQKYAQPDCPAPTTVLRAADARARRLLTLKVPAGSRELVLSPSRTAQGALAWQEPREGSSVLMAGVLVERGGKLQTAPYRLDSGRISRIRISGLHVTWLNGSTPHHATLHVTA